MSLTHTRSCPYCGFLWHNTNLNQRKGIIPAHLRHCRKRFINESSVSDKRKLPIIQHEDIVDEVGITDKEYQNIFGDLSQEVVMDDANYPEEDMDMSQDGDDNHEKDILHELTSIANGESMLDSAIEESCRRLMNSLYWRSNGGPENDFRFDYGRVRLLNIDSDLQEFEDDQELWIYQTKQNVMLKIMSEQKLSGSYDTVLQEKERQLATMEAVRRILHDINRKLRLSLSKGDYLIGRITEILNLHGRMDTFMPRSMRRVVRTVEEGSTEALFNLYEYKKSLSELFCEDAYAYIFHDLDDQVVAVGYYLDPMDLISYQLLHLNPDIDINVSTCTVETCLSSDGERELNVYSIPSSAVMTTVLEPRMKAAYGNASVQLPINIAFDATKVRNNGKQTETPLYMHIDSLKEPVLSSLDSYMLVGFLPTLSVRI